MVAAGRAIGSRHEDGINAEHSGVMVPGAVAHQTRERMGMGKTPETARADRTAWRASLEERQAGDGREKAAPRALTCPRWHEKGKEPMSKDTAREASHHLMPRGEFLKHSLQLIIIGARCLWRPGRHALAAESAGSPKPPLTEENLNQFVVILRKSLQPDSEALKTQATRDWRALLREQFTLTPLQKRALEDLPRETVAHVQEAIREALHANLGFTVRAIAAEGAAPARSEEARVAAWTQPDAVLCTRSNEAYECIVKAGVVC
jgi:hypothetical protein